MTRCRLLDQAIGEKSGIQRMEIQEAESGKIHSTIVFSKTGAFRDRGIIFQYCPFCGGRIFSPRQQRTQAMLQRDSGGENAE